MSDSEKLVFMDFWYNTISMYVPGDIAQVIVSQFALESAFGTSHVYRVYNNLCGMKMPKVRFTLAHSSKDTPYAVFDSPLQCFYDYLLWLNWNHVSPRWTVLAFLRNLGRSGYAEDKDYISKILTIKHKYYGE